MHPSEQLAVLLILAVGAISLGLCVLALSALRRTGNRKLAWVAAAFAVFAAKGLVTALALAYHRVAHEHLELIGSGLDLLVVALLVVPFLLRR